MLCDKYNVMNVMWQIYYDKCNVTYTMKKIQWGKYNEKENGKNKKVTIAMRVMQWDECSDQMQCDR